MNNQPTIEELNIKLNRCLRQFFVSLSMLSGRIAGEVHVLNQRLDNGQAHRLQGRMAAQSAVNSTIAELKASLEVAGFDAQYRRMNLLQKSDESQIDDLVSDMEMSIDMLGGGHLEVIFPMHSDCFNDVLKWLVQTSDTWELIKTRY